MNTERLYIREDRFVSRVLLLGIMILGANLTWALLDFQLSHESKYISLQARAEVLLEESFNAHGDDLFRTFNFNQCAMVVPMTEECKITPQQASVSYSE